ncbi:MAG: acylphosphatase [Spirochaetota bacterium]
MDDHKEYSVHAYISGNVQGVGFRFFAVRRARTYGITGWVRNLSDGRVEIRAEGIKDSLIMFLEEIKKGPGGAQVTDIDDQWEEITLSRYDSFNISF